MCPSERKITGAYGAYGLRTAMRTVFCAYIRYARARRLTAYTKCVRPFAEPYSQFERTDEEKEENACSSGPRGVRNRRSGLAALRTPRSACKQGKRERKGFMTKTARPRRWYLPVLLFADIILGIIHGEPDPSCLRASPPERSEGS